MIQKPIFSTTELYCIETAVKEDLQRFNDIKNSCLKKEDENDIINEFNNILNKINEWKKQECDLTEALRQLKPVS